MCNNRSVHFQSEREAGFRLLVRHSNYPSADHWTAEIT